MREREVSEREKNTKRVKGREKEDVGELDERRAKEREIERARK